MSKRRASVMEMKNYLGCTERPVSNTEMMDFWKSLTDDEKTFFAEGIAEIIDAV